MKRMYDKKEEGIASTVGTIFALMIFMGLLSLFMTQVVPVQMKSNEAEHDLQVLSQLSQMRSIIDMLTLTQDTNYTAYVPIKMGAEGVAIVTSPTYGQLSVYPAQVNSRYILSINFMDTYGNKIYENSSGSLQFICPNRYYVPEIFTYENGAIWRYNFYTNTTVMPVEPNIKFSSVSLGYTINVSGASYVDVPNSASLNPSSGITLEAWVNLRSLPTGYEPIISKSGSYALQISNTGIQFLIYDSTGTAYSVSYSFTVKTNMWYHIAGTFDGTKLKIYLNGVLKNSYALTSTTTIYQSSTDVIIGNGLVGYIDEVRVMSSALSATDIETDYLSGAHYPSRAGAVLWLHFDEGSGLTAYDSSTYGNDGTLQGATWAQRVGVDMALTLQNIFGNPDSITGYETRNIGITLQGVSQTKYSLNGGIVNITVNSDYPYGKNLDFNFTSGWISYITNMLNESGLRMNVDYTLNHDTITIYGASSLSIKSVYIEISVGG